MDNIAKVNSKGNGTIMVTGHTDNVPLVLIPIETVGFGNA